MVWPVEGLVGPGPGYFMLPGVDVEHSLSQSQDNHSKPYAVYPVFERDRAAVGSFFFVYGCVCRIRSTNVNATQFA